MSSKPKIRFGFEIITGGPYAGFNVGTWVLWTSGVDTYLTATHLGNKWKLSLHDDRAWRFAVPSENMASDSPVLPAGHDRAPWKFTPPPFANGRRKAFVIAATRASLCLSDPLQANVVRIPVEDRWDAVWLANIWMTEHGEELAGDGFRILADPLPLANGRRVWLAASAEHDPRGVREDDVVNVMVEPLWQEKHGVNAPGILLRGLRWDYPPDSPHVEFPPVGTALVKDGPEHLR